MVQFVQWKGQHCIDVTDYLGSFCLLGEIDTRFSFCAVATLALLVSFKCCVEGPH